MNIEFSKHWYDLLYIVKTIVSEPSSTIYRLWCPLCYCLQWPCHQAHIYCDFFQTDGANCTWIRLCNIFVIYWEEEILRKIYGLVTEQGVWRIRPHQELGELYKTPYLAPDIKRRLYWLGVMVTNGWNKGS